MSHPHLSKRFRFSNIKVGSVYGRWEVVGLPDKVIASAKLKCRCQCGTVREVNAANLVARRTESCGCLRDELASERRGTHRASCTLLFGIWGAMRTRCENKNSKAYKDYGGRGIRMCDEWRSSFEAFRDWATSYGYRDGAGLSIERKDVNGNYEPDNCEWIPKADQARNRRNTAHVTAFGETKSPEEWSRDPRCCVRSKTLRNRLAHGLDPEYAMTLPPNVGYQFRPRKTGRRPMVFVLDILPASQIISQTTTEAR